MDKLLLCDFKVGGETYHIWGTYEIVSTENYKYPEFGDLSARKLVDGVMQEYLPCGSDWYGKPYGVSDMANMLISGIIAGNESFTLTKMDAGLKELINFYVEGESVAEVNNLRIPKYILGGELSNLYEAILVTNRFIYYGCDDMFLMLDAKTHEIISNNYFAEICILNSLEMIKKNAETLVYISADWGFEV